MFLDTFNFLRVKPRQMGNGRVGRRANQPVLVNQPFCHLAGQVRDRNSLFDNRPALFLTGNFNEYIDA
ncbi:MULTISPECIES: hypothetical protein [Yersinia pseudotuberculosis complex]|uniref:hypothetical protein n=1 Tax=Yersinia pseudotuberculosis complex TaxID=1649845 RepID=UPI0002F04E2F|nr:MULTISPECIES: hypothetical protein [Yersinia pseudotuberculosis complex]MCE4112632.1 hypothetical protein [Yersinia pseudotuberculosis]MCF1163472.1 hypothetical protein [Yersinia pseudotuberculosis]RYC27156.1 hypothetical protein EU971_06610 [Yersinia pseudotuberculosis]UFA59679.1 Uncharacterized protein YP598_0051 [Yersinia pseudotuberculosis]WLF03987.1 hypothetical protein Q6G25_00220 [Yersinia pseudotuberculosis]